MQATLRCDDPLLVRNPRLLTTRVAGIPLLRRHLLAYRQAGIRDVVLEIPEPILAEVEGLARRYLPAGVNVTVRTCLAADSGELSPAGLQFTSAGSGPAICQSALTLVDPRLITQLASASNAHFAAAVCADRPVAADDVDAKSPYRVGVPDADEARPASAAEAPSLMPIGLTVCPRATEAVSQDMGGGEDVRETAVVVAVGRYYWHRVENPADARVATWKVLLATMKATDGIYARTNRRVSLRISRLLLNTPVTANMMTVATLICGIAAGWLLARGDYASIVAGSAMAWFASMLDGVDGELARAKFQASALGHWLEMTCDYVFYIAIVVGLGAGLTRVTGQRMWLAMGIAAALGVIFSFTAVARLKRAYSRQGQVTGFYLAYQRTVADPSAGWFMRITPHLTAFFSRAAFPYYLVLFAILGLGKLAMVLFFIAMQSFWIVALYAGRLKVGARR